MKRPFWVILTATLCASAHAETMSIPARMGHKALRGAVDLVTGIVELPMQTVKGYQKGCAPIKNRATSKGVGTVLGIFRGISHTAGRVTHGGRELFAFWTADQPSNEGIGVPFDAEYAWQMGESYSLLEPNLKEGITPIGRKLATGLANTFTGLIEIPRQIVNAKEKDTSLVAGTGKGVYFFLSRTIYGATDVMGLFFLVPNQESTYGYPYCGMYPWNEADE